MRATGLKQAVLKPQDLVVVIKLALSKGEGSTYAQVARALVMSASEVHAAVRRAIASHLLELVHGTFEVNHTSLREFLLHGVRYAFPVVAGPVLRGLPTGISAPPLNSHFAQTDSQALVWPDPEGTVTGHSICALYPSVPAACKLDPKIYQALALLDALRGGAAREREMAGQMLLDALE